MTTTQVAGRRWRLAVAGLLGALCAAPYFPSCLPSHGAYPTQCVGASCPGALDTAANLAQTEANLNLAQATSVVNIGLLGDWEKLEKCQSSARDGQPAIYVGDDPTLPGTQTIYCYRDLDLLRKYLRTFVAHQSASNSACNGGRVGFINLAPIFSHRNVLPKYLAHRRFNHADVWSRWTSLLTAVIAELSDPAYVLTPEDRAFWFLSIGNEIDMYLNDVQQPYPRVGASAGLTAAQRWAEYRDFFVATASYIRNSIPAGLPVGIGTTVRWGADPARGDGVCGPYELAKHHAAGTSCSFLTVNTSQQPAVGAVPHSDTLAIALHHLSMAAASDVFIYTRYFPDYLGRPPGSVTASQYLADTKAALLQDFGNMAAWSNTATYIGATTWNRNIVIQEISHPSAHHIAVQGGPTPATALAQHAIADQQSAFIAASFQAWEEHNGAEPPADVVSLNWFNLYDFANVFGSPCYLPPGGTYLPPVCSWGLLRPDGQGKGPAPFTSFFQYALNGIDVNPPESGVDPARACSQP